jgi:DNA-directed RNA polymerase specialized sigma24 family protein
MTTAGHAQVTDHQAGFLALLRQLKRLAHGAHRHITHRQDREDAIADAIAGAWELFQQIMRDGSTEPKTSPLFKRVLRWQRRNARRKHRTCGARQPATVNVPGAVTPKRNGSPTPIPLRMPPQYEALMEQLSLPPAVRSHAGPPT